MTAITLFMGILIGVVNNYLDEPKFLKKLQDENESSGKCSIKDEECAKVFIQQHLISNVRSYYSNLNSLKPFLGFMIGAISITFIIYFCIQLLNENEISNQGIFLPAFMLVVINAAVFFISLYLYVFSQIIRKYE